MGSLPQLLMTATLQAQDFHQLCGVPPQPTPRAARTVGQPWYSEILKPSPLHLHPTATGQLEESG